MSKTRRRVLPWAAAALVMALAVAVYVVERDGMAPAPGSLLAERPSFPPAWPRYARDGRATIGWRIVGTRAGDLRVCGAFGGGAMRFWQYTVEEFGDPTGSQTVCTYKSELRLDGHEDLVSAFKDAFDGDGPNYVFDALWGEPGAAAVLAAAPKATVVNLGQSAGATAALSSEAVRFRSLAILGFSVYTVPFGVLAEHYRRLIDHAVAGDIRLDVELVTLDSITEAWRRQADGAGAKLVVVP